MFSSDEESVGSVYSEDRFNYITDDEEESHSKLQFEKNFKQTDESHPKKLMTFLKDCYDKELFCDVSVKVGNKIFKTHCVVLSMTSEYFKALLQMDNEKKDTISLTASFINDDLFEKILTFAYTGSFDFTDTSLDIVHNLAIAADYLGILSLKEFCENQMLYLLETVSTGNVVEFFVSSEIYNMKKLFKVSKKLLAKNYLALSETKEFFEMPSKVFQTLLQDNNLAVYKREQLVPPNSADREKYILKSVLKYIDKNVENDNISWTESSQLLKSVKLLEVHPDYLKEEISKFPNLKANSEIKKIVDLVDGTSKNSEKISEFWKMPRKLKHSFKFGASLASSDRVGIEETKWFCEKDDDIDPFAILKHIIISIRRWDGRRVVGALGFTDSNGVTVFAGEPDGQSLKLSPDKYEINLEDNEVITEVTASSGWVIDNLEFKTNFKKTYGPYGGDGGGERSCLPHQKIAGNAPFYLHSFRGASVRTQDKLAIVHLSCRWVTFLD